jgi:hypothetical protein
LIVRYGFSTGEQIECPGLVPGEGSITKAAFDELLEPLAHIRVPPCPGEEAFVCDGALYGFEVVLGSTRFSYQWHTIPPKGWEPIAEWLSGRYLFPAPAYRRTVLMKWQPLFPGCDREAGTDADLDTMLRRAFDQQCFVGRRESPDTTGLARQFALEHGWPLPQPETLRRKRLRCLVVILGAILATLLLGQVLESLRRADQRPRAAQIETHTVMLPTPRP